VSLGLSGGLAPPPTPPVRRPPPPPPAPTVARSAFSSPSLSGSYNSKRKGLSGGAAGPSPESGSIGGSGLSGSLSIAFPFFTEGSSLSEVASFTDLPSLTECASPSSSPTSAMGLADYLAFLIAASKNSCSFFSCFLTLAALGLSFTFLGGPQYLPSWLCWNSGVP